MCTLYIIIIVFIVVVMFYENTYWNVADRPVFAFIPKNLRLLFSIVVETYKFTTQSYLAQNYYNQ